MAEEDNSIFPASELPQDDPEEKPFVPEALDRTVIAIPLLHELKEEDEARLRKPSLPPKAYKTIIDVNLEVPGGRVDIDQDGFVGHKQSWT